MKMAKSIERTPKIIIYFLLLLVSVKADETDCPENKCNPEGPAIRFPFHIKGIQNQHCGYSDSFELSCTKNNNTILLLPNSVKFFVKKIDYKSQTIHLIDPNKCLQRSLQNVNLSVSPFRYMDKYTEDFIVFYCSSEFDQSNSYEVFSLPSCVNASKHNIYAASPHGLTFNEVLSCTKMYDLVSVPREIVRKYTQVALRWPEPDCSKCERKGNRCRLNSNSTTPLIECHRVHRLGAIMKMVISASAIGAIVLLVVLFSVLLRYKTREENQVKVEKFLADYEAFKPTRYSYSDLKRITNQFSDQLGEGACGTVYKGKISNEVFVAVKILKNSMSKGEEFINEVEIISKIHHVNIVRMVGFCADGFRRALVYEFLPNGSLQNNISSTNEKRGNYVLGLEKMRDIALGVAKGIEYLHQGCDQRILHFDIKPNNVLLDQNFNPKISDFGTAKLYSKDQSMVSMTAAKGTVGYIAPEVFSRNFGGVSYKSDVYSFGVLLLEMVKSKRNKSVDILSSAENDDVYFPEWIYTHLDQGLENFEIDNTEKEDNVKIAMNLAIVGLWCIQWQPADRPSMSVVVKMIEGKEEMKVPSNPFVKSPFFKN